MTLINPGRSRSFVYIALLAMLLRAAMPAGFMPSALADGWYLQLCPHGLSPQVAEALFGTADHHHHHGTDVPEQDSAHSPLQCEFGSGFAASALVPTFIVPAIITFTDSIQRLLLIRLSLKAPLRSYDSRAGPLALC